MRRAFWGGIALLCLACWCPATLAQTYTPDDLIHTPPDYTTFTPPAKGGCYNDQQYGYKICRLTDGQADFGLGQQHLYSKFSPMNADDTYILVQTVTASNVRVIDKTGALIRDNVPLAESSTPRWHPTNKSLIYYFSTNVLRQYNVDTAADTVVRTFAGYTSATIGGGEGDISWDGNHMAVEGVQSGGNKQVFIYRISDDTIITSPVWDPTDNTFDNVDVDSDNNLFSYYGIIGAGQEQSLSLWSGTTAAFIRKVAPSWHSHDDRGRMADGTAVTVMQDQNDPGAPPVPSLHRQKHSDGTRLNLGIRFDYIQDNHVSGCSFTGANNHDWVLITLQDTRAVSGTASIPLAADWATQWNKYYNEIFAVKLDNSQVRRLAHHRTDLSQNAYYGTPRSSFGRTLGLYGFPRYVVFDSTMRQRPGPNPTTDVYLLDTSEGGGGKPTHASGGMVVK